MKEKWNRWLPVLLVVVFALTRWPGLLPPNFSAAYALAFCAGVYFPSRIAWWLPLATLAATDIVIDIYYTLTLGFNAFQPYQLINYAAYILLIALGRRFRARDSWWKLLTGGVLGAILFYLLTNTASWFFNAFNAPEYTKNLAGWLRALSTGTPGHPPTWEFFRNTLMSGGLFTGLFAGAMKLNAAAESAREKESPEAEETEDQPAPEAPVPEKSQA